MENRGSKSLAFLAQKACFKYLKRIYDIGECPYDLIRPVLLKLENPEQLYQLEINSPQILGHNAEIWQHFIKRDIPDWESKAHRPKDGKSWGKVYKKLKEQTQKEREQGVEKLKAALSNIKDEREQNLAKVVSRKDLPMEPNPRVRTLQHYHGGKIGSKPGHKLTLLEKIRKEAREAREARLARIKQPTSPSVKKPTKAPLSLVEDYKLEVQQKASTHVPTGPLGGPKPPRPPLASQSQTKPAADKSLKEKREKLRALTVDKTVPMSESTTVTSELRTKLPTTLQAPSTSEAQVPQSNGVDDNDDEEPPLPDMVRGAKAQLLLAASSPPKRRAGTPPPSRFGTLGPRPKRKVEPSVFMTAKKPKLAR